MSKIAQVLKTPLRRVVKLNGRLAEARVWPTIGKPNLVLIMVPGNPGLIDFYEDFLSCIYQQLPNKVEIVGVSHQGHSAFEGERGETVVLNEVASLKEQIDQVETLLLNIVSGYGDEQPPKIVLCGHSVGAYICQEVFKRQVEKVSKVIQLFPTIMHIRRTPNGDKLRHVFHPLSISILSFIVCILRFILPERGWRYLIGIREKLIDEGVTNLIVSKMARPQTVKNCASMAIEEMNVIKDLDTETYTKHKDKFIMYFGTSDSWVPLEHYETIRKYTESSQTHLCEINMTHSFCIGYSEEMAEIAVKWLKQLL